MNKLLGSIVGLKSMDLVGVSDVKSSLIEGLDFDTFNYYFDQLVLTQHDLNIELCGLGYDKTLVTDKGKLIRYGNALISESNELLDSTPWKHWKNTDDVCDTPNIATELIDYLHFLPSLVAVYLKNTRPDSDLGLSIKLSEDYNIIKLVAWNTLNSEVYPHDNDTAKITNALLSVNSVLGGLCNLTSIFNKDIEEDIDTSYSFLKEHIKYMIAVSFGLTFQNHFTIFNSSIESIWSEYIVKNTLNSFRKDNGYKEGTYIKIWNDLEDNEVAKAIMSENPKLTKNELYEELTIAYKLIKGE